MLRNERVVGMEIPQILQLTPKKPLHWDYFWENSLGRE